MCAQHFSLLKLTRSGFDGSLARVAREQLPERGMRLAVLKILSRFISNGVNLLGLRAGIDADGRLSLEPTGLLARGLGRRVADNIDKAINGKGKPLVRRDGQLIFTLYQPPIPSAPAMKVLASRLHLDRTGRPLPATATLQATTRCQADCIHCSAARHRARDRPELSTDEFRSLVRQAEALGVVNIVFTGGEPLLRLDIYELISWVDKDEAIATMFSNGLLLTGENVARLKDVGLFSIMVSLDSPEPEDHNRMRRVTNCWEKAVEGMSRILDAGILCGISTYATPERLRNGQVMGMIELGRRIGVHEITIFDTVPTGRLLREDEHTLLTDDDKAALCQLEKDINSRSGYPHVITQAHVNGPTGAGCYAAWFQFYMTAYGDVMPCDFTPLAFGNIRDESLDAIWQKMIAHPAYHERCPHCRMQDPDFRSRWIDAIPSQGPYPYPIDRLDGTPQPEAEVQAESPAGRSSVGIRA